MPFLLVALSLCVEVWGRWVELLVSLAGVGMAFALFRRVPLLIVALAAGGALVPALVVPAVTNPVRVWPFIACVVVAYLAGRRLAATPVVTVFAGTLGAGLLAGVLVNGLVHGLYDWFVTVLVLLFVAGGPWLVGRYRRQGAEMVTTELDRAAAVERNRIAREMHDSLGYEWGLIALRAAALEVAPGLDDDHRARIGELRAGVADATERLREIVTLLGEPDDDMGGLVARARAAGQHVALSGTAPAPVARLAHRVVREGLTNAAKHAAGQPVAVRIDDAGDHTTVAVENALTADTVPGTGTGLAGLREDLARLGGELTTERRDGRFVLTATLPHTKPVAPSLVWRLVRVPLLALGVVVVLGGGLYFLAGSDNRLDPAVYATLHIGQSQEDVEAVLPRFQMLGDPEPLLPAPPDGADCRRYWATEQTDDRLFYRLCFVDGRLATKETVPR